MSFPACKHRKRPSLSLEGARWLASEPFRLFFASGILWSIIGVSLWPLFYAGKLGFFPNFMHARLMIEAFGGAFVVGFLGTAGPRMASAPKLTPLELAVLFVLHMATGISHLTLHLRWGDACFLAMLVTLLVCLASRVIRYRKDWPPPQMLLALTGLLCGIAGTAMWLNPATWLDAQQMRMAGLLLYQGLLLPPVLGIGSFLFPRILGGEFGEPATAGERRRSFQRALSTALLLVASFFLEVHGYVALGYAIRCLAASAYLWIEIPWRSAMTAQPMGTLSKGLRWALGTGALGLALPAFFYAQHIALEHLIYIGGFGLLILIVASRVLFGHSGELAGFSEKSKMARTILFLAVLAATTRASADFKQSIQISHYKYAAWTWGILALLWFIWHRRRFFKRDES